MKTSVLLSVLFAGLLAFLAGCETPGYSGQERFQMIGRNQGYEYEQINDDIDHLLLLRPRGHLTRWDLR